MPFNITGVGIQSVASPISLTFTGNDVVQVNYPLNLGTLVTQSGKLTGDDQNNDGFIQRGETVDHDNPNASLFNPIDLIPDLNNASVLGVGKMSAFISGAFVHYPVILVRQGSTQYLLYPQGTPELFTNLLGTINTTITFFPHGRIGPGGTFQRCFARGTRILTEHGEVPVEAILPGDRVQTVDHGLQPVRWIGGSRLTAAELVAQPQLRPIRIKAGALGPGLPANDLIVSPQHRILVRSRIAQRMFGTQEVLVAAKQLRQLDGIDVAADLSQIEYFHMLFDRHEVIYSEGAATEALFTGNEALLGMADSALEEILTIFPTLRKPGYMPDPARLCVSGRMGRQLAARHARNGVQLVA